MDAVTKPLPEQSGTGTLNYQANRSLDRCPGFVAVLQVRLPGGRRLAAALRRDALEVHTSDDVQYLFDYEGRFLRATTELEFRFRSHSHRGLIARKEPGRIVREHLSPEELERSCRNAWEAVRSLLGGIESGCVTRFHPAESPAHTAIVPVLRRAAAYPPERLALDGKRFSGIYQPVPILPPDQYSCLVLQATEGCSFDSCTFCNLYRGVPFRIRDADTFSGHIRRALAFHGEGLRRMNTIFLGQANAIAAPQARLEGLLEVLGQHVELPDPDVFTKPSWVSEHSLRFLGIGSFLDGFTGLKKTASDYSRLRRRGLTRVYLGVESGSDRILQWMKKPATTGDMHGTLRHLKDAGMRRDVILLVGAGGNRRATEHLNASLDFLATAALEKEDRIYLSDLVPYPNTPYPKALEAIGSRPLSPEEMDAQRTALRNGARELGLQAVPYRVEPFVY